MSTDYQRVMESLCAFVSLTLLLTFRYYIFDYNLVEPAYLTTTDIRHDLFGFMLTYGDWGFLSRFYPISFMGFLAVQGGAKGGYITQNYIFAGGMMTGFKPQGGALKR